MLLDPTTIILMATLMGGAMSIVLFSAHRSFPLEIKGLGHWAGGLVFLVAAALLYGLRRIVPAGSIPDFVPMLCANCCLLWGIGLSMIGTQKFYGTRPSWYLFHTVWVLGTLANGYWTVVHSDFVIRVATFSFLVLVFYMVQVVQIAR